MGFTARVPTHMKTPRELSTTAKASAACGGRSDCDFKNPQSVFSGWLCSSSDFLLEYIIRAGLYGVDFRKKTYWEDLLVLLTTVGLALLSRSHRPTFWQPFFELLADVQFYVTGTHVRFGTKSNLSFWNIPGVLLRNFMQISFSTLFNEQTGTPF